MVETAEDEEAVIGKGEIRREEKSYDETRRTGIYGEESRGSGEKLLKEKGKGKGEEYEE